MYKQIAFRQVSGPTGTAIPHINGAVKCSIHVTGQSVRWRSDGVAPTSSVGEVIAANDTKDFALPNANLRIIETAATAVLNITYYTLSDEFEPQHLANLVLHLDCQDRESVQTVGNVRANEGDRVARWRDKSPSALLLDEVSGSGPLLKCDGPRNLPYLYFDGADFLQELIAAFRGSDTAGELFIMLRPDADEAAALMCPFSSSDNAGTNRYVMVAHTFTLPYWQYFQINADTQDRLLASATTQHRAPSNCWQLLHVRSDGSTIVIESQNNAQGLTASSGANNGDWLGDTANRDDVCIGARIPSSGAGNFWKGAIAEVVLTSSALTTTERQQMRDYFNRKWGVLRNIAVLGDSWVEDDIAPTLADQMNYAPWASYAVHDHGVGSETILQIGARWDSDIEAIGGYDRLVLEGGVNSINGGVAGADVYTEYARIVNEALVAGLRVVCCTIPTYGTAAGWSASEEPQLLAANALIRTLALSDPRLRLVDIYTLTREPGTNRINDNLVAAGGLHLNQSGNEVVAAAIKQALRELEY
jgi:lysophospholipase L1-like esterase